MKSFVFCFLFFVCFFCFFRHISKNDNHYHTHENNLYTTRLIKMSTMAITVIVLWIRGIAKVQLTITKLTN